MASLDGLLELKTPARRGLPGALAGGGAGGGGEKVYEDTPGRESTITDAGLGEEEGEGYEEEDGHLDEADEEGSAEGGDEEEEGEEGEGEDEE
jgi:hypothetical protein